MMNDLLIRGACLTNKSAMQYGLEIALSNETNGSFITKYGLLD